MRYGVFAITRGGVELGRRLVEVLPSSRLHIFERFEARCGEKGFKGLKEEVEEAFRMYDGLIFIMATGAVVRTIAPFIRDKTIDPAVVVIDEKGRYVISLLSGHLGGANELTRRIAGLIDAEAVITTATDVNGLPCIEEIASRLDCVIEDKDKIKLVNSAIVNMGRVIFIDEESERLEWLKGFLGDRVKGISNTVNLKFYNTSSNIESTQTDALVFITEKVSSGFSENTIFLRPRRFVVGIGCNRGVRAEEIEMAYLKTLQKWKISPLSIKRLATIDIKRDEEGLLDFARRYNLGIDFFSKDELSGIKPPSGVSLKVMERIGIGGVCEPAAMLSAGVEEIWIKKERIGRVTIAIAKVPFTS